MNLFVKNQCVSISPSKIRGRTPPPPGGRSHEVPEEGEWAGALMLPRWTTLGGIDAPQEGVSYLICRKLNRASREKLSKIINKIKIKI